MPDWICDRRLYLTGGGLSDPDARVVEHNHPEANWLLCAEGQILASGYVARFNLPASLYAEPDEAAEADVAGEKQADPPSDKQAARPADKSRPGPARRRST